MTDCLCDDLPHRRTPCPVSPATAISLYTHLARRCASPRPGSPYVRPYRRARVRVARARRQCPPCLRRALVGLLACGEDQSPTEPEFKPAPAASFTVSPTALQFIVPRDAPATLTVTSKTANTIAAASSSASCLVSPASAALTKPRMGDYTGTFTVTPSAVATGPGTCTITLTDKKGGQTPVVVTLVGEPGPAPPGDRRHRQRPQLCPRRRRGRLVLGLQSVRFARGRHNHEPVHARGGDRRADVREPDRRRAEYVRAHQRRRRLLLGRGRSGQVGDGGLVDRTTPAAHRRRAHLRATHGQRPPHLRAHARGQSVLLGPEPRGPGRRRTTTETRAVPTAVANAIGGSALVFASLEAGGAHACGLTSAGKAYCWGYNETARWATGPPTSS